jgi:NitT/TauT family transport system substrate-binding protein
MKVKSLIVLTATLLASCGSTNTPTVVKYVGLNVYDPVYIAIDKGFFEDEGVEVELVNVVAGGATAVQMVASGQVQGALVSTMAKINAVNGYLPIIGVADIQSEFEDTPLEQFFVRADSNIYTMQDLIGKRIAINLLKSSFHYTWLKALEDAGIAEDAVTFVSLPFAQQEEALLQGSVDVIGLIQPWTKRTRDKVSQVRTFMTGYDVFGARQFCTIFINSVWANTDEVRATKFVTALSRVAEFVKNNQQEAKEIVSKYTGIAVEDIDDYKFQEFNKVKTEDAQYWLDWMIARGEVRADITVEQIVTNRFNQNIV